MTPQEGSSLLESCARRSFSFTRGNLQAFATQGLRSTGLDSGPVSIKNFFSSS